MSKTTDKIKEIKAKKKEDLEAFIKDNKQALQEFRFSLSGSKIKNLRSGRSIRKDIARAYTIAKNSQK